MANVNEGAPLISSNGGGASASVTVSENAIAVTTVAASDADGTGVTYAIFGGADAARFAIDASTGALSFVSAPNFEAPTDAGANNVYDVIVGASDGGADRYPGARGHREQRQRNAGHHLERRRRLRSVTVSENSTAVTTVAGRAIPKAA